MRPTMRLWLSLGAMLAGMSGTAVAADNDIGPVESLGEIVVTARRTEENLQNTPVSITALSTIDLDRRGVTDVTQLTSFVPNLNFLSSTGLQSSSIAFAFIRGIGQTNGFVQNDPGVGMYVDGVYIGRTQGAVFDVLDLQRVEVLRGPQGTLYGRNTIGGAINLVSNPPAPKTTVTGSLETGNFGLVNGYSKLNVAFTDRVFASIALADRQHGGYVQALSDPTCPSCTGSALSNDNTFTGRVALRVLATDGLTFDLAGDYTDRRNRPIGIRLLSFGDGVIPPYDFFIGLFHQGHTGSSFVDPHFNTHQSNFAGYDHQIVNGASLTTTWQNDVLTLKSISAYRGVRLADSNDGDGSPLGIFANAYDEVTQKQYSQELQILQSKTLNGHLDWQAGIFAYKEDVSEVQDFASVFAELPGFGPPPGPPPCYNIASQPLSGCIDMGVQNTGYRVRNGAVYGNGTYHFTDRLSASAGVRYSHEKKSFDYAQARAPGLSIDTSTSWNSVTPRAGVEYQLTPEVLLYGSYSEGFKSGAFNNGTFVATGGSRDVAPEKVKAYELGVKSSWFENRLIANLAGYLSHYTDQQLQVTIQGVPNAHAFINAGRSQIYGSEFELKVLPTSYLRVDAGLGWTHTEITDVAAGTVGVSKGAHLPYTPEINLNAGVEVIVPTDRLGRFELRGDWSLLTRQYGDNMDTPLLITPGRQLTNFRGTWFAPSSKWSIYAFANNAFNKQYRTATASVFTALFTVGVDGPPRTYGVGARVAL